MKKILIIFVALFMLVATPVEASTTNHYNGFRIQSSVVDKVSKKSDDEGQNFTFYFMLVIAFAAISVFIIAYKSDDGSPDD